MNPQDKEIEEMRDKYLKSSFKGVSQEYLDTHDIEEFDLMNYGLFCIQESRNEEKERIISIIKKWIKNNNKIRCDGNKIENRVLEDLIIEINKDMREK